MDGGIGMLPERREMANRTNPDTDHLSTTVSVMVGRDDGPKAEIAWIEKAATWKDARLENHGENVIAIGMADIHAKLLAMLGEPPVIVLPLHRGYWGMYDGGPLPFARAMSIDGHWSFRRLNVHQSVVVDTLDEAVAIAYGLER